MKIMNKQREAGAGHRGKNGHHTISHLNCKKLGSFWTKNKKKLCSVYPSPCAPEYAACVPVAAVGNAAAVRKEKYAYI